MCGGRGPYAAAAGATRVTLKHLLRHTAGANVDGFPGYAEDEVLPTLLEVLDGNPPANTPPVRMPAAPAEDHHGRGLIGTMSSARGETR